MKILSAVELDRTELEEMEEGTFCSAGLMCLALTTLNYPAHVGWYLDVDDNGYDRARIAYAWRFEGDPLGGVYCEDCTIDIEEAVEERG